jgi:hypothetical protein
MERKKDDDDDDDSTDEESESWSDDSSSDSESEDESSGPWLEIRPSKKSGRLRKESEGEDKKGSQKKDEKAVTKKKNEMDLLADQLAGLEISMAKIQAEQQRREGVCYQGRT